MSKRVKPLRGSLFIALATSLLAAGFFGNIWRVTHDDKFKNFLIGTESMVIGRLILANREGVFSQGGLNGSFKVYPNLTDNFHHQYEIYFSGLDTDRIEFIPYFSQPGWQGLFFALLDQLSPFEKEVNYRGFQLLNSLLTALAFAFFLLWAREYFGLAPALICLAFLLLSPWLTLFGKNIWWFLWIFYLPFLLLLFSLRANSHHDGSQISLGKIFTICFLGSLAKCLFTGYEYISTTLVMLTIPLFFYQQWDRWPLTVFLKRFAIASGAAISGVLVSMLVLIYQVSIVKGSLESGLEHIVYSFSKRTHGNSLEHHSAYTDSLNSDVWDVLSMYFQDRAVLIWDFKTVLILFALFSGLAFLSGKHFPSIQARRKQHSALIITTTISLLAPLSWLIIFKGHSYIHPHMNFITWYMPTFLLGFTLIGSISTSLFQDARAFFNK